MEEKLPYLTPEERTRCQKILIGLKDNLRAVESELSSRERPYKSYLTEKLDNIYLDLSILRFISKVGDDDDETI